MKTPTTTVEVETNNTNTGLKVDWRPEDDQNKVSNKLDSESCGGENATTAGDNTAITIPKCVDNNNESIIIQTDSFKTVKCLDNSISCDKDGDNLGN
jgi:hypothetical protein